MAMRTTPPARTTEKAPYDVGDRRRVRAVGILLLAAFLLYGGGSAIATNVNNGGMLGLGVALMLANSASVLAIGLLLLPVLRPFSPAVARGYLLTRILEAAFLAAGAIALLVGSPAANLALYSIGMAILGIGSLFFCALLLRARLVPAAFALWGLVGYAAFAAGSILELLGVTGAGLMAAAPGGLFELAFALWLITRGLADIPQPATRATAV